jgi:hypothetical protein
MKFDKVLLAKAFTPLKKEPPYCCRRDKTIAFNEVGNLLMFKDTRKEAQDYIRQVLPTLLVDFKPEETAMKLYNGLDNQWLEFDFTLNLLYLCTIKKS